MPAPYSQALQEKRGAGYEQGELSQEAGSEAIFSLAQPPQAALEALYKRQGGRGRVKPKVGKAGGREAGLEEAPDLTLAKRCER